MSFFCFGSRGGDSRKRSQLRRSNSRSSRSRIEDYRFYDGTPLPIRPLTLIPEVKRVREVRPGSGKSFSERVLRGMSSQHFRQWRATRIGGHYAFEIESDSGYPEARSGSLFREALRPHRYARPTSERYSRAMGGTDLRRGLRPHTWPYKITPVETHFPSRNLYADYPRQEPRVTQRVSRLPPSTYCYSRIIDTQAPTVGRRHSNGPSLTRRTAVENMAKAARRPKLRIRIPN